MTNASRPVLVVDDSPDNRELLVEYLTFRGFHVVEAANGDEAITQASTRRPAVILMDLQMPGMDGWEATRQLKADPATHDVIIIAVTAHALTPAEDVARRAGCDGFIAKPFDITALGDALGDILQHGRRGLGAVARLQSPHRGGKRRAPAST